MFKKTGSSVFSGFKNTRRSRVFLDPIKHVLRVFWTPSKAFHKVRVHLESKEGLELWEVNISIQEKQAMCYYHSLYKEYWRKVFYQDIKLIHVTFYRCFERLLGSWIINEFLKCTGKKLMASNSYLKNATILDGILCLLFFSFPRNEPRQIRERLEKQETKVNFSRLALSLRFFYFSD